MRGKSQELYLMFLFVLVATASIQVLLSFRVWSGNLSRFAADHDLRLRQARFEVNDKDRNCIFRDSPLYRSVYVYPSPGEPEWTAGADVILSEAGKRFDSSIHRYPWQPIEERTRANQEYHFRLRDARAIQYTTELIVREILTHPDSCLRTNDPEKAALFFVPYMVSMEWHNGTQYPKSFETSPYGQAILDIMDSGDYRGWENTWGYTSSFWKRRQGSDHILVMSEGCHGLSHPRSLAGNDVFIKAQKQLTPPIIIYKDTSKTFVTSYPNCAAKNLVVPAPNPDGRWFNGRIDQVAQEIAGNASFANSPAALPQDPSHRPLAYYYKAGNHGSCRRLRQRLETSFECSPSGKLIQEQLQANKLPKGYHFPHAFRHATFCPSPGGDTPNSKRYFDALMAGCIPLILSGDFVWPYSTDIPGTAGLIQESDISIRLDTIAFMPPAGSGGGVEQKETCESIEATSSRTIQKFLEAVPAEEIARLQGNLKKAAAVYSYYETSPDLPDHPLLERVLPNGPAAHALVAALADRAYGNRWPACQAEVQEKDPSKDNVHTFQC